MPLLLSVSVFLARAKGEESRLLLAVKLPPRAPSCPAAWALGIRPLADSKCTRSGTDIDDSTMLVYNSSARVVLLDTIS